MRVCTRKELRAKHDQTSCYLRPLFRGNPLVLSRSSAADADRRTRSRTFRPRPPRQSQPSAGSAGLLLLYCYEIVTITITITITKYYDYYYVYAGRPAPAHGSGPKRSTRWTPRWRNPDPAAYRCFIQYRLWVDSARRRLGQSSLPTEAERNTAGSPKQHPTRQWHRGKGVLERRQGS